MDLNTNGEGVLFDANFEVSGWGRAGALMLNPFLARPNASTTLGELVLRRLARLPRPESPRGLNSEQGTLDQAT